MTWYYNDEPLLDEHIEGRFGFVYCITNMLNGKKYIGKKLFTKAKTKTIKGKKKKTRIESDWKDYYGSNKLLNEEVEKYGKEHFKREVLMLCNSRGECNYYEAMYQFDFDVLLSDMWYNDHIWVRVHRTHLRKK
jgi:hypothetical protein